MRKKFEVVSLSGLLFGLVAAMPRVALGYGAGITGYSGKTANTNCNICHSGGPVPTVTITGPTTLAAGQVGDYVAKATVAAGGRVSFVGGIDVAVDDSNAVLGVTSATTSIRNGEVTHNQGLPYTKVGQSYTLSIPFTLQAPSTPGTVTMFADMLAGAGQAAPTPDYGTAITFKVTVGASVSDGGATGGMSADGGTSADGGVTTIGAGGDAGGGTAPGSGSGSGSGTGDGTGGGNNADPGATPPMMGSSQNGCSFAPGLASTGSSLMMLLLSSLLFGYLRRRRS